MLALVMAWSRPDVVYFNTMLIRSSARSVRVFTRLSFSARKDQQESLSRLLACVALVITFFSYSRIGLIMIWLICIQFFSRRTKNRAVWWQADPGRAILIHLHTDTEEIGNCLLSLHDLTVWLSHLSLSLTRTTASSKSPELYCSAIKPCCNTD